MSVNCNPASLVAAARCFCSIPKQARRWVKSFLLCQATSSSISAGNFGASIANAWAANVVANGGPMPSQNSINAVAAFANTTNNAGVWSKLLDVNILAPDSLIATLTPIKVTYGSQPWVNTGGFVGADLDINGLQGNGTKYINTNINLNSPPAFTGVSPTIFPGISVYVSAGTDGSYCEFSWIQNNFTFYTGFTGTCFFDCYGVGPGRISAGQVNFKGFVSGNRESLSTSRVYHANSTTPFVQIASTVADNVTAGIVNSVSFAFANNNGVGTPLQFSQRKLSFIAFHYGLVSADCQTLFNAVQALRTSIGGGFV